MSAILAALAKIVITVISSTGYFGVFGLMLVESAGIPFPSEVIMPFSGYLASQGVFSFWLVVVIGALGNLSGSLVAYEIARRGGRPLVHRFGRAVLLSERDLERTEAWFGKYGPLTVVVGRVLPIVRTYISFPAGLAEMPIWAFVSYTLAGSLVWSWLLTWLGFRAGANWVQLRERFHGLDVIIAILLLLAIAWWIWRHWRERRRAAS